MKDDRVDWLPLSGRVNALVPVLLQWESVHRMERARDRSEAEHIAAESGLSKSEQAALTLPDSLAGTPGSTVANLFRFPRDCHNAKVLLRGQLSGRDASPLLPGGSVPERRLRDAVYDGAAAALPDWLARALADGRRAFQESRSVQLLDTALDRACFAAMRAQARFAGDAAQAYVRLRIDGINLQTLLRRKADRGEALEELLLPGGNAGIGTLLDQRASGHLGAAFAQPLLREAAVSDDAGAAERAVSAALLRFAQRCSAVPYGPETVLGFLLQLELLCAAARLALASAGTTENRRTEVG